MKPHRRAPRLGLLPQPWDAPTLSRDDPSSPGAEASA